MVGEACGMEQDVFLVQAGPGGCPGTLTMAQ